MPLHNHAYSYSYLRPSSKTQFAITYYSYKLLLRMSISLFHAHLKGLKYTQAHHSPLHATLCQLQSPLYIINHITP